MAMSPSTRRTRRGREGFVLDNVTAAPFVTNDIEPGRFLSNCPDEMVIFARGRRSIPLTFSPDVITVRQRLMNSSMTRQLSVPNANSRLLLPTRTSPRKRLTLADSPPSSTVHLTPPPSGIVPVKPSSCPPHTATPSPDSVKWSPVMKKRHVDEDSKVDNPPDPATALKALTKDQLLNLLANLMLDKPEIAQEVEKRLPEPDLAHMEDRLSSLKRNISRALPNTRLESKTDSMAYNRVSSHLLAFKKAVLDQAKNLTEACAWKAVLDHVLMSWAYVKATPVWDNPIHNNIRKSCFKSLSANCMLALKRSTYSPEFCLDLKQK